MSRKPDGGTGNIEQETRAVASSPGLDLERVLPWFREQVEPVDSLTGSVIGHGRSNITYRLASDGGSWVLRRPPPSHVPGTAPDMGGGVGVLSALAPTGSPWPQPIAACSG